MTPERLTQIEDLYHAALEHEPAARGAFLAEACGTDEELRREVESLLAQAGGESPLNRPAWEAAASLLASADAQMPPGAQPGPYTAGQSIAHYQIVAKLGEGGMGAVYRAHDTQLRRQVALKVLPPEYASDPERRSRLLREARAASALNHPNIVGIHEVGSDNGVDFIAMEFVEGKCLRDIIPAEGLPVEKALDYAAQIAGGLAKAHAAGVIHRDLKPSNIMLTPDGLVKLLDFGLARRVELGEGHDTTLTVESVILGTPSYMSPEQAQGKPMDVRSDVFSFGSVLYEMVTGRRAFEKDSNISTLAAIVEQEPLPLSAVVPRDLEKLLTRCLRKDTARRFQHMDDVQIALQELKEDSALGLPDGKPPATPSLRRRWMGAAAISSSLLVALAMIVTVTVKLMPRAEPALRPSLRLTITLPADAPLAAAGFVSPAHDRRALALSPDGARLAYVAQIGDKTKICVRDMASGKITPLDGTERGHTPFFSPEGASIGFFADGKLKRIPAGGGTAVVLADAPMPFAGIWGADDAIYFNRQEGEGIFRIAADGGPVQVVTTDNYYISELLGSGPTLLADSGLRIVYIDEMQKPRFVIAGFGARYAATGHLLYAVQGRLMAVPWNRSRIEAMGPTVSLFEDLRTANYGVAQFALAQDGTLIYASGRSQLMTSFVWVDRRGRSRPLGLPEGLYRGFDISPDGRRLALTIAGETREGESAIWIYDLLRGTMSRLTPRMPSGSPAVNLWPRWTPDSLHVIYNRRQESHNQLIWASADGGVEPVVLWSSKSTGPEWLYPMSFSPDSSVLTAFGPSPNRSYDIWLMPMDRTGRPVAREPELFLGGPFAECFGQISPDGHWMLYNSDHSGRYEIYVTSYPKPGAPHQVSRNGGREPLWNPKAPEIVYLDGNRTYAVDVTLGPEFRAGEPRLLFEGPYPDMPGLGYDISSDGKQFLMLESKDFSKTSTTLTVITGFFDELRRRVPSGNGRK
jgi:serine/threonine protein kinase/Tol biopolymer transport system component